jgi:hypothetical protein
MERRFSDWLNNAIEMNRFYSHLWKDQIYVWKFYGLFFREAVAVGSVFKGSNTVA